MSIAVCEFALSEQVIAAALTVHKALGPGLLEAVYEKALMVELRHRHVTAQSQVEIPLEYRGEALGLAFRADIVVEERLVLEIKSVTRLDDVHLKQLITYLKLSGIKTGLLMNFNGALLMDGVKRVSI